MQNEFSPLHSNMITTREDYGRKPKRFKKGKQSSDRTEMRALLAGAIEDPDRGVGRRLPLQPSHVRTP